MIHPQGPYKNYRTGSQLWNTRKDGSLDIQEINEEPTMTQQQFQEECDINNIMKSYMETGTINHRNPRPGVYADFSEIKDFRESLEMVMKAEEVFNQLPAKVRARFENDPGKLIEFCNDKNNLEEAISLGIAEPKVLNNAINELNKNANNAPLKKQPKNQPTPPSDDE